MFFSKSADRRINKCVDPSCVVKERHVWHSFGRGKMRGLRRKNNNPKKQRMQIEKKTNIFEKVKIAEKNEDSLIRALP